MRRGADQSFEPLFDSGASKYVEVWGGGGTKMVQVHAEILHQGTAHTHIHLQGYLCEDIF